MARRGAGPRCARCALPTTVCFCEGLVPIRVATPIAVISHPVELEKPSSTGSFGALAIEGLRVFRRGDPAISAHVAARIAEGRRPVLLYPDDSAVPLDSITGPIALYAADGNWRQAKKVGTREPALRGMIHARLDVVTPRRRLRRHPSADHLATLEAIGYALGILEGASREDAVLASYDRFVDAVAKLRGWGDGDSIVPPRNGPK